MEITHSQKRTEVKHNIFYQLLEQLPAHIFWKDTEGMYLGCNSLFARSIGFSSPDDIIGKTDYDFPVMKTNSDSYRADDIEVMKSKKPKINVKEEQVLSSGKISYLLTSKVPLFDECNQVIGVLGIYSDITKEKLAEELAFQYACQEKQLQAMELLANAIAHELRTPLVGISLGMEGLRQITDILKPAYDYALENGYKGKLLETRLEKSLQQLITSNKKQARDGLAYIDIMLASAKTGTISANNFQAYSIRNTINQAISEYPFQNDNELSLVKLSVHEDFLYAGDENYMKLVFFNLIRNSLHFIDKANKGEIFISSHVDDDKNVIVFHDTGSGIEQSVIEKIFKPFYSGRIYGSGIGLSFCLKVIDAHRGNIHCESVVNEYTKFTITLPKSF